MVDWTGACIVLWCDEFMDIYIVPLTCLKDRIERMRIAAVNAFYDCFKKDDVEAIGTEIKWALEKAGFKEKENYVMFFDEKEEDE